MPTDPQQEQALLDSIESVYYEDDTVDTGLHELQVCSGVQ